MAVKFEADLNILIRDLENRGYRVRNAKRIAGAPGRTADVFLDNDVVVRWDSYSQAVWAEGPARQSQRTESYLRLLYDGGIVGRCLAHTLCFALHVVAKSRHKVQTWRRANRPSPALSAAHPNS